ncbi:MAG: recombinase family protein [Planctomycetota bacterium]|jgi:DNA invertase Pin-like site-specific DNA recombinase
MNKRKKRKRKRLLIEATKKRLQDKYPRGKSGKASNYIHSFGELVRKKKGKSLPVVLFARVSARAMKYKGNLQGQVSKLKDRLKQYKNVSVIAEIRDIASGWKEERSGLQEAVEVALRKGAVILAESTDRYIRSVYYHSETNPSVQPTDAEYKELMRLCKGVTLSTWLHPDTDWKEVRSYQTKRGQDTKNNKGGRPTKNLPGYMIRRQIEKLPIVLQLREEGKSIREISFLTGIPKSTIADWLRRYPK